jgi:hypothetical protein
VQTVYTILSELSYLKIASFLPKYTAVIVSTVVEDKMNSMSNTSLFINSIGLHVSAHIGSSSDLPFETIL